MKTVNSKKKKEGPYAEPPMNSAPAPNLFGETQPPAQTAPAPKMDPRNRIVIPLNEDGSMDWETMREATREKVREAFQNTPQVRPPAPQVEIFHPAMVSGLYDLIGTVENLAAQRFFNVPEPVAKQVFTYSPAEKSALAPPTVRVLNKYASAWMIKYQDELALASLLMSITVQKINAAMMLSRAHRANTVYDAGQAKNEETDKKEGEGVTPLN